MGPPFGAAPYLMRICPTCKRQAPYKAVWKNGVKVEGCRHCVHAQGGDGVLFEKFCDAPAGAKGHTGRFLSKAYEKHSREQVGDTTSWPGHIIPLPAHVANRHSIVVQGRK